ncbi:hypothetical protein ACFQVA_06320 [Actinomadura keratinilytica]
MTAETPSSEGIRTYKGEERALRADRLGTTGLLLSVLAASAPSWSSRVSCPRHSA